MVVGTSHVQAGINASRGDAGTSSSEEDSADEDEWGDAEWWDARTDNEDGDGKEGDETDDLMRSLHLDSSRMPRGSLHRGTPPSVTCCSKQSTNTRASRQPLIAPGTMHLTTPRRTRVNLVKMEELGRGAGGIVHKALHLPTMTVRLCYCAPKCTVIFLNELRFYMVSCVVL